MRSLHALLWAGWLCLSTQFAQAADYTLPGSHAAGWSTVSVTRPGGATFSARFYYPATSPGSGAPYDGSKAPYPAVSFGHGFLQPPSAYAGTLQHLASWGYFVIASESEGGFAPSHQGLADDMRACLDWLTLENTQATSTWFQQVDTLAFGMSGHSMGAGASVLAATADPRVIALANLAAAETTPSAVAAAANAHCAASFISGSADSIVPVASNGQLMYGAAPAPRLWPVITGGYHCGFVDAPAFGGFGCDSGTITKAAQLAITKRLLTAFFELYLRDDQSAWDQVWGLSMRIDAQVQTSFDPGVVLSPYAQRKSGFAGSDVTFTVTLLNTGTTAESYTLLYDGILWPVISVPANTGIVATGASVEYQVVVTIPAGTPTSLKRFVISARRDSDGATRAFAVRGVGVF